MGFVVKIGVQIRKSVIVPIRTCYRSVCSHPFLVAMLLFLIFLYRSFPSLFSLLVYASPVFVSSCILLGTLLIFGQANLPEIEKEQKISHDIASRKTEVSRDDIVVERDGSLFIERISGKTRETADNSEVEDFDGSVGYVPLIDESLQHNQSEKRVSEDMERELDSKELESQRNIHKEKVRTEGKTRDVEVIENQYSFIQKVRDEKLQGEDDISHKEDHLESSQGEGGGDDADDDEGSDYGSNQPEISSPDASMADILSILDELHPLLDLEAPQPAYMSHDESDVASDRSNDGSNESDGDVKTLGGQIEEDGVDDNDGDEEEAQGGEEDESKSAIKWTEDDQMNVMDLGNLELERNQCLETLIARRRATKSFSLAAEKNLIDLDSSNNPFNVTPISTTRNNPFDPQYDSYHVMGLPPIPGSAPSILLPRRNPFHLPYELNEEKPDLKGEHFEQTSMTFHPKDAFFSRHESFSLGSTSIGDSKQGRHDFKWRPIFVPEQLASEGTSYSSLQRQSSEASDSKVSSVADTESVSSAADLDERKFNEQDFTKEAEVISNIFHAYDLVGHGSQSSEDVDSQELERAVKRDDQNHEPDIKLGKVENLEPGFSGTGRLATPVEITNEIQSKPEAFKEEKSSRSSLSSLPEVNEKVSDARKVEQATLERTCDLDMKFEILTQPPLEEADVQFTSGTADDNQHNEPIYDSSPTASEKVLSFDSISSDLRAEISKMISNLEADIDLPKTLDVKAASSNSSNQYVPSPEKPPSEGKKDLSWSDKSMVEPRPDNHNALHAPAIILSESKENSSITRDANALEAHEVQEPGYTNLSCVTSISASSKDVLSSNIGYVVQEPITTDNASKQVSESNVGAVPKPLDSKDEAAKIGNSADGSCKENASSNRGSFVREPITTDTASKQVSEGNVGALPKPFGSKDELAKAGNNADGSSKENALSNRGTFVQEPITTDTASKKVSEGNVVALPKPSISKDELAKVGNNAERSKKEIASSNAESDVEETVAPHIALKQASEAHVGVLTKPPNSKDGSAEVKPNVVGSSKELSSSNAGSDVYETLSSQTALKGNLGEIPKPSDSKDGSTKVGTNAVSSPKEVASNNAASGVRKTIGTETDFKQVVEGNVSDFPKPSNSKDGSEKLGTSAVGSTKEIASTNTGSSVPETICNHTASKQVSEGNIDDLPKPSDSKAGSTKFETNVVDSTKEVLSTTAGSGMKETVPTHTALKQVPEGDVGELPKPSNSKDELTKVATNAVGSAKENASRNTESGIQETVPTHSSLKQVSEGSAGELPKPPDSEDGSTKVGTNTVGSTMKTASSNTSSGVQESIPVDAVLKRVSEGIAGELPKPSNSHNGSTKFGTSAAGSAKEIASSHTKTSVPDTSTIHTASKQVSEGNGGELPKPLTLRDESEKVGTNAMSSTKEIASSNIGSRVQETATSDAALRQVSEGNISELPKPSDSNDGSTKVGTNAAGSAKEIASSNTKSSVPDSTTHSASKQISEGNFGELPKQSDSKQEFVTTNATLRQVSEGNVGELPRSSSSNDGSTKVGTNAASSATEIASSNTKSGVPDTITPHTATQVSKGNVGELREKSDSKDESTKVGTTVVGSMKENPSSNTRSGGQDTITSHSALKEVSEGNLSELPKPSDSKDGSTKEETNAAGSTKEEK